MSFFGSIGGVFAKATDAMRSTYRKHITPKNNAPFVSHGDSINNRSSAPQPTLADSKDLYVSQKPEIPAFKIKRKKLPSAETPDGVRDNSAIIAPRPKRHNLWGGTARPAVIDGFDMKDRELLNPSNRVSQLEKQALDAPSEYVNSDAAHHSIDGGMVHTPPTLPHTA